jgi:hypothetical protein
VAQALPARMRSALRRFGYALGTHLYHEAAVLLEIMLLVTI